MDLNWLLQFQEAAAAQERARRNALLLRMGLQQQQAQGSANSIQTSPASPLDLVSIIQNNRQLSAMSQPTTALQTQPTLESRIQQLIEANNRDAHVRSMVGSALVHPNLLVGSLPRSMEMMPPRPSHSAGAGNDGEQKLELLSAIATAVNPPNSTAEAQNLHQSLQQELTSSAATRSTSSLPANSEQPCGQSPAPTSAAARDETKGSETDPSSEPAKALSFQEAAVKIMEEQKRKRKTKREQFPEKLYRILQELESEGLESVASFVMEGKAFEIHKPHHFENQVIPKYFRQQGMLSFKKQLRLYNFKRLRTDRSGYKASLTFQHENFLKGRPDLCVLMERGGSSKK